MVIAFVLIGLIIGTFLISRRYSTMSDKAVYVLKQPLRIESTDVNNYFFLPEGTALYYDRAYPEGFSTLHVYIDVKGEKLLLENISRPDLIAPEWADIMRSDEYLLPMLESYPLTKDDLLSILKQNPPEERKDAEAIINHLKNYIKDIEKKNEKGNR